MSGRAGWRGTAREQHPGSGKEEAGERPRWEDAPEQSDGAQPGLLPADPHRHPGPNDGQCTEEVRDGRGSRQFLVYQLDFAGELTE